MQHIFNDILFDFAKFCKDANEFVAKQKEKENKKTNK
jgi:hypothetical protein